MESLVESATNPQFLLAALSAIAVFATFITLVIPLVDGDKLNKRMKAVTTERERLRQKERARLNEKQVGAGNLRLDSNARPFVQQLVDTLDLRSALDDGSLADKLAVAGIRGQKAVVMFLFFRVTLPLVCGLIAAIYIFGLGILDGQTTMIKWLVVLAAAYFGFYLPNIYLKNRTSKRQTSINLAWPDALDLLLICVESGMSVEPAFKKVSEEVGESSADLAAEMALTTAELSFLSDRKRAYENLAKRTGLDGVKAVTLALIQAEKYGTPLGQALRVMAQENRDMRMAAAEKKAAALPPKLTVPMILFFLPVLFIVIMTPAVMDISANF